MRLHINSRACSIFWTTGKGKSALDFIWPGSRTANRLAPPNGSRRASSSRWSELAMAVSAVIYMDAIGD